jgi:hypothetical protein
MQIGARPGGTRGKGTKVGATTDLDDADSRAELLYERAGQLAKAATGGRPVVRIEAITADSYSHTTFKVHLDGPPHAVAVQFARRAPSSVTTSAPLLSYMATLVDVPEVLHCANADDDAPPALVTTWLEGRSLNRLLPHLPGGELDELARAVAETANQIWSQHLPAAGFIAPDLTITPRPAPLAACIDTQLHDQLFDSPGGQGLGPMIRERLWSRWQNVRTNLWAVEQDSTLVHGDLAARNLLARQESTGAWRLAVLDWEFAVSGCHLADVGHLLRPYPFAPPRYLHALTDVLRGLGRLEQEDWREIAWALDLTALTGPLVHGPGHPDNDAVIGLITTDTLKPPA